MKKVSYVTSISVANDAISDNETRYYISSIKDPDPKIILKAVRDH